MPKPDSADITWRCNAIAITFLVIAALAWSARDWRRMRNTQPTAGPPLSLPCDLSSSVSPEGDLTVTVTLHNPSAHEIGLSAWYFSPNQLAQYLEIVDATDHSRVPFAGRYVNRVPIFDFLEKLVYIEPHGSIRIDINLRDQFRLGKGSYGITLDSVAYDHENEQRVEFRSNTIVVDLEAGNRGEGLIRSE